YAAVCAEVQAFVSSRQDKLLETLANVIAEHLLKKFALRRVELELRKFILPETRFVAVRIVREKR
ncbi:MAG: dihydroneopterin aldolase, partial [Blastocatellia bacterium]|nr:dihydroneopterin aldolase [Blastocatellia bacterium]